MTDPFRSLDPPSGGWRALTYKLQERERRRLRTRRIGWALATLALLTWWFAPTPQPPLWSEQHPALALLQTPDEPVRVPAAARARTTLLRVETPDAPNVVLYRVERLEVITAPKP